MSRTEPRPRRPPLENTLSVAQSTAALERAEPRVCPPRRSARSSRTRLFGTDIGANTSRAPSHGKHREISQIAVAAASPSRLARPRSLRHLASTTTTVHARQGPASSRAVYTPCVLPPSSPHAPRCLPLNVVLTSPRRPPPRQPLAPSGHRDRPQATGHSSPLAPRTSLNCYRLAASGLLFRLVIWSLGLYRATITSRIREEVYWTRGAATGPCQCSSDVAVTYSTFPALPLGA